ncbi:hypothetical protein, partial [Klebsiella pneumoniae]|uniref:hypothetical protein n=1 Tax=Klebsiella pneumoniae TaxID=573 RepID=UPI0030139A78
GSTTRRSSDQDQQRWRARLDYRCRQQAQRETGDNGTGLDANDTRLATSDCILAGINRRIETLSGPVKR